MTTPRERMRALRSGAQLLELAQADPVVPLDLRHRAAELSRCFPSQSQLLVLLADRDAWFARDIAQDRFEAGMLFEGMELPGRMSPATRQLWRGTMRHYPSRFNGWHRPEDFELFRVSDLLDSEDALDRADCG